MNLAAGDVLYFVRPKWLVSRVRLYVAALQHGTSPLREEVSG